MKINKIQLTDFRGFKGEHEIKLHPNLNVLVGVNGSGKTTILEAVVNAFQYFQYRLIGRRTLANNFSRQDVNVFADEYANCQIRYHFNGESQQYDMGVELRKSISPKYKLINKNHTNEFVDSLKKEISFYKGMSLPILAYYHTERAITKIPDKSTTTNKIEQVRAWKGALEKHTDFKDFFEWFRILEDSENEIRLNEDINYKDPQLEAVREAIESVLDGFVNLRARRMPHLDIVITKKNINEPLSVNNQLSHGEKITLALIGDLARRLAIANPQLKNPLEGEGVILIDEIDLHLHPKWQKTIVKKLREVFPNIQFILTTHSPLIISQLKPENIILLENNQCVPLIQKGINSYGLTIEDVLVKIQGTTQLLPEEVDNELRKLFDLIEEGKLEEAKAQISRLETIVAPSHPELMKGDADIKFKELMSS